MAEAKLHLYSIGQWPCDRADVDRARIRYVYFVTCDIPDFPVKIGSAFDVEIRMRALQGAMPWPLQTLLIIEGDERKERELHEVFADLRMKGEWFARHPSLLEYIKSAEMVLMPSHREEMAS